MTTISSTSLTVARATSKTPAGVWEDTRVIVRHGTARVTTRRGEPLAERDGVRDVQKLARRQTYLVHFLDGEEWAIEGAGCGCGGR
jgi:hypothetical protein